jgi:cAMP and cAMP-inhibited cGMP 3',5'-cyclic phosphodiesterase 10
MFVGAICHDLDHRGFNNKFMIDIGSPLAAIYSTSTMEHHHFNMTVTILQQVLIQSFLFRIKNSFLT